MERYRVFHEEIKKIFGQRLFKVTVNAGMTCPNVDGSKARGGCTFCQDTSYTGLTFKPGASITNQISDGLDYVKKRHKSPKVFAYFQNGTNTYAPLQTLRTFYDQALTFPEVAGLMIATRPDNLPDDVIDYLAELHQKTYLWIELGLQSHRNDILRKINRAHTAEEFVETTQRLHKHKIRVGAHVILGLPGETPEDSRDKALFLNDLPLSGVKVHNLVVFKNTTLEKQYRQGLYQPLTLEHYTDQCIDFLEHLRPDLLIQRINAHGPRHETIAPEWSINKWNALNAIHEAMEKRDSWQGKKLKKI